MRSTPLKLLAACALALGVAACDDSLTPGTADQAALTGAFDTPVVGFETMPSSFDPSLAAATPWMPAMGRNAGKDGLAGPGHHGPGGMMGGGIGIPFLGGGPLLGFGRGVFGDGHQDPSCTFNATSGRVECPPVTRGGVTVTRSVAYTTAAGVAQAKWDSVTTDKIDTRVTTTGTLTRRDGGSTTVNDAGQRSVAGLAKGSTQVTINGAAVGRESTTGKDSVGTFTVARAQGDTTRSVVIPVSSSTLSVPKSGTVVRAMTVTVTRSGSTTTTSRREVVTYNGTDTATVVITKDGTTSTCKLPLKRFGPPSCG
jgi:hypothetical protein